MSDAYTVVSDPSQRAEYDAALDNGAWADLEGEQAAAEGESSEKEKGKKGKKKD